MARDPRNPPDRPAAPGSPDDRPDQPAAGPRVGDILSGRVSREQLDPTTIAELAAWFGAPAQAVLQAEAAAVAGDPGRDAGKYTEPSPEQLQDPDLRSLWERRRRAMDAADPALVARIEARCEQAGELIYLPEPMSLAIETELHHFDLSAWKLNFLDIHDREIDEDIYEALREQTPQAVLRDLHRPEIPFALVLSPMDLGVDIAGQRAQREISTVMTTRYDREMAGVELASRAGRRQMAELRARLAEPWENSYIPESERRGVTSDSRTAEDFHWFGGVGIDPFL